MKNTRGFALGLVIGLALALSSLGFAQTATQSGQKGETESCCAMSSCCCNGDSCQMKHDSKSHASMQGMEGKHGCCCCSGDSCEMKMKEKDKEKTN
jgi:hypothetical protein